MLLGVLELECAPGNVELPPIRGTCLAVRSLGGSVKVVTNLAIHPGDQLEVVAAVDEDLLVVCLLPREDHTCHLLIDVVFLSCDKKNEKSQ